MRQLARGITWIVILSIIGSSSPAFTQSTKAETNSNYSLDPYYSEVNENVQSPPDLTAPTAGDNLDYYLSVLDGEGDKLQATYGETDDNGTYHPGDLRHLKLKPSDKQRLIKIANGSATKKEQSEYKYDQGLMDLLTRLTEPKDLGGGGLTYLRVGDLLRFSNDPRSKETENTDNISQHQQGKAADVIEINTVRCTKSNLLHSRKTNPIPVKVVWQGGAPPNPNLSILGSFDALSRANAFRDILGALPGDSYNGSVQGFDDLLQQLSRRVVAQELSLDPASLDYVQNGDYLATVGREVMNQSLGYDPGALSGNSKDENLRSIPRAALEKALLLPPSSLAGDNWNQSIERLGRMIVAYQIDVDPQKILANDSGTASAIKNSPYFTNNLDNLEELFRFPAGTLNGVKANQASAFRKIGAQYLADRLSYSPSEQQELINQAANNQVKQLNLARHGDITTFQGPILPIIAPQDDSSKAAGERYTGNFMLNASSDASFTNLPDYAQATLNSYIPFYETLTSRSSITSFLIGLSPDKATTLYRQLGARALERTFDLPDNSLAQAVKQYGTPSLDQFIPLLEQQLKSSNKNTTGTTNGQTYMNTDVRGMFDDLYHIPETGPTSLSVSEMYDVILGKPTQASSRTGASWVEEDLGLVPNTFTIFFTNYSPQDRLVYAGVSLLAGEFNDAFDVTMSPDKIQTGRDYKLAVGRAAVETLLGLNSGSFQGTIDDVKAKNADRYKVIFADPTNVDDVLNLPAGTANKLTSGQVSPDDVAIQVGGQEFNQIDTADLNRVLGWTDDYKYPGDDLADSIDGKASSSNMRPLLAKLGSYNTDYAFGYTPGIMSQWLNAKQDGSQNWILMKEGARLYSDRLGISNFSPKEDDKDRNALLNSYIKNDGDARQSVTDKLKKVLETKAEDLTDSILSSATDSVRDQISQALDQLTNLKGATPAEQAAIDKAKQELQNALDNIDSSGNATSSDDPNNPDAANTQDNSTTTVSYKDILTSIQTDLNNAFKDVNTNDPDLAQTKDALTQISQYLNDQLTKAAKKNNLPAITIPQEDLNSFVTGDMKIANAVLQAAVQAKELTIKIDDTYKLMRLIIAGWSPDSSYEQTLFNTIAPREAQVNLENAALNKAISGVGDALAQADILPDAQFKQIVNGVLTPQGTYTPGISPYNDSSLLNRLEQNFLANKEAHNNLYYGVLDYQASKLDPNLPKDFSKTLMEGSNEDRAKMMYAYLTTKLGASIKSLLPADVQKLLAAGYAQNQQTLDSNQFYANWANSVLSLLLKQQDATLPDNVGQILRDGTDNQRKALAYQVILQKLAPEIPAELLPYLKNFDPTTGQYRNPKYDSAAPASATNQPYLPPINGLGTWVTGAFNKVLAATGVQFPPNAADVILNGTDIARESMAFSAINGKINATLGSFLPDSLAQQFKNFINYDPTTGKISIDPSIASFLHGDTTFTFWASTMIGQYIGQFIPKEVADLAIEYLGNGGNIQALITEGENNLAQFASHFLDWGKDKLVALVGHVLGMGSSEIQSYYNTYKQAKAVYSAYKAGKLDSFQVVIAIDQLVFGGAIEKFLGSVDDALGLPSGTVQNILGFFITGNPIYLALAIIGLFATTVKCPNLQKEAQKNVKLLISTIIDLGQDDRTIIPSQIITYDKSYLSELMGKIKTVYNHCLTTPNSRCGVFARPEYVRQVHLGF